MSISSACVTTHSVYINLIFPAVSVLWPYSDSSSLLLAEQYTKQGIFLHVSLFLSQDVKERRPCFWEGRKKIFHIKKSELKIYYSSFYSCLLFRLFSPGVSWPVLQPRLQDQTACHVCVSVSHVHACKNTAWLRRISNREEEGEMLAAERDGKRYGKG